MVDMDDLRRARKFAQDEKGNDYVFGTQGPNTYDCSGFMSVLVNVLQGKQPRFKRLFGTGTMASVLPGLGFKKEGKGVKAGAHDFVLGFSTKAELGPKAVAGHTAGSLGGLNVESRGSKGVLVGAAARSPDMKLFKHRMFLPITGEDDLPPKPRPFPGKLKRGDSGPHVRLLQEALIVGGAPLKGTGTFGPKTEFHVKAFQLHRNLPGKRGVVHKSTWDKLMLFLGPPTTTMITVGTPGKNMNLRTVAKPLAKKFFGSDTPANVTVMVNQLVILNPGKLAGETVLKGRMRLKVPTTKP
jgi:Putative peptidoglycan binding domain